MKPKQIFHAFSLLSVLHLLGHLVSFELVIAFTKPLLMVALALYFIYSVGLKSKTHLLIFIGLIFSQLGDTFLMYASGDMNFFMAGIGAFLVTQCLYSISFYSYYTDIQGFLKNNRFFILPFVLFWIGMLYVLLPVLPNPLKIPVAIYSAVIVVMNLMALNLKTKMQPSHWRILMCGTLLFLLSDTLIAVNKFLMPLPIEGLLIMSTYLVGQLMIVEAFRKEKENPAKIA
jgi:uncharacterized membrane protein YhhN